MLRFSLCLSLSLSLSLGVKASSLTQPLFCVCVGVWIREEGPHPSPYLILLFSSLFNFLSSVQSVFLTLFVSWTFHSIIHTYLHTIFLGQRLLGFLQQVSRFFFSVSCISCISCANPSVLCAFDFSGTIVF